MVSRASKGLIVRENALWDPRVVAYRHKQTTSARKETSRKRLRGEKSIVLPKNWESKSRLEASCHLGQWQNGEKVLLILGQKENIHSLFWKLIEAQESLEMQKYAELLYAIMYEWTVETEDTRWCISAGGLIARLRVLGTTHVGITSCEENLVKSLRRARKTVGAEVYVCERGNWSSRYDVRGTVGTGLRCERRKVWKVSPSRYGKLLRKPSGQVYVVEEIGQVATTCEEHRGGLRSCEEDNLFKSYDV
ncbi:hypothetical protein Tco_0576728 [Tanacetum coccineum]